MILVIIPGVLSMLSLFILAGVELHNQRIFRSMPRIRSEKREEACVAMLPILEASAHKNHMLAERIGWNLSGVFMGYIRVLVLLTSFSIGGLIILTNNMVLREEIIRNMSMGKSFIELQGMAKPGIGEEQKEIEKIRRLESQIPPSVVSKGGDELWRKIQEVQSGWSSLGSEANKMEGKRLGIKLMKLHEVKYGKRPWIGLGLISLGLYLFPIPLGWIKGSLTEEKKREEIIRLYETMLLYGELPPYELRTLMVHLVNTAVIYKPTLGKVVEGVKVGYGERILEEAIRISWNQRDWGFVDLLEHLKSFYLTGVLSKDRAIENIIERKTKLEELFYEKKRGGKIQLASIPLGVIIGLGTWYFMLGTMSLSNMSILGH